MRIKLIEVPEIPKMSIIYNLGIRLLQKLDFRLPKRTLNTLEASINGYRVVISFGNEIIPGYNHYPNIDALYTSLNLLDFYDNETDIITIPNVFIDLGKNEYLVTIRNASAPHLFPSTHQCVCEYCYENVIAFSSNHYKISIDLNNGTLIISNKQECPIHESSIYTYYEDPHTIRQNFLNGEHTITVTIRDEVKFI